MGNIDPRIQLYNATFDCLERIKADFTKSGLATDFQWTDYYDERHDAKEKIVDFFDPASSIVADQAVFSNIHCFDEDKQQLRIVVQALIKGRPYARKMDLELDVYFAGMYNIALSRYEEVPPTIFPAGNLCEDRRTEISDLHSLVKSGYAEILGESRARALLELLPGFSLDLINLSGLEPIVD